MYDFNLYEVVYEVLSMNGGDNARRASSFCLFRNAAYVAERLSLANDVVGEVNIINGLTGEIEATFDRGREIYLNL